jgi:diguanylate cyclase (GGDEF)-like protein
MGGELTAESSIGLGQCASEPVNSIGHTQSHGVLFALSESDLCVRQVSANVSDVFGLPVSAVIGASLGSIIGTEQLARFRSQSFIDDHFANALPMVVGTTRRSINCLVHRQGEALIVEFEPLMAPLVEPIDVADQIRMFWRMEKLPDIAAIAMLVVGEIKKLTGFDRVMICQFDPAGNRDVLAEVTTPTFGSYFGLRFPASNIPVQVRRLLLLNPSRLIADVNSVAVPIVPALADAEPPLDLTHSYLRSASPIHLQFLRNMNVGASMTVSIIVKGQLWGLIACDHPQPRSVEVSARMLCELIAGFLASQIAHRIDNRELKSQLRFRKNLAEYLTAIDASKALADAELRHSTRLLDLLEADGVVSCIDSKVLVQGTVVRQDLLEPIIRALALMAVDGIASSNKLGALDPSAIAYAGEASGALYMELTEGSGDYLVLLRRELVEIVPWAGNPDDALSADDTGILRPRASFATWLQTVRGQSRSWTALEIENAKFLRAQLVALRAVQKSHDTEDHIRFLAGHDVLTGLINRPSIERTIEQNIAAATIHHGSFAVLFLDLDDFKSLNDTFGHATGDAVLKIVAARIIRQVRSQDSVGRLGGDEFVVVIPGALDADAFKAAARILRAIQEPLRIDHHAELRTTASIGVSRYPADGTTTDELLARSDAAMYRVKVKGGNALETFGASGVLFG